MKAASAKFEAVCCRWGSAGVRMLLAKDKPPKFLKASKDDKLAAFKEKKANIAASKGNKPKPKPQTKPVKKAQPKTGITVPKRGNCTLRLKALSSKHLSHCFLPFTRRSADYPYFVGAE